MNCYKIFLTIVVLTSLVMECSAKEVAPERFAVQTISAPAADSPQALDLQPMDSQKRAIFDGSSSKRKDVPSQNESILSTDVRENDFGSGPSGVTGDLPLLENFSYRVGDEELSQIVSQILELSKEGPPLKGEIKTFYTDMGMSHLDSFIPYRDSLQATPEDPNNCNKWIFTNGRVRLVETIQNGERWVSQKVWYDSCERPILVVAFEQSGAVAWYMWGEYVNEKLHRVLAFHAGPQLVHVYLFDYSDFGFVRNEYHFSGLNGALLYANFDVHGVRYQYNGEKKKLEYWIGTAGPLWDYRIRSLEKYGLASVYPRSGCTEPAGLIHQVPVDIADQNNLPELAKALRYGDERAKWAAVKSMTAIGKPSIPYALEVLSHGEIRSRELAVTMLQYLGPEAASAVPQLAQRLRKDQSASVRNYIARCLGSIGPAAQSAIPALERAAAGDEPTVALAAKAALEMIRGARNR